jgi:hypothetical protein
MPIDYPTNRPPRPVAFTEIPDRVAAASVLFGKRVRFAYEPPGFRRRVLSFTSDGMVEIEGFDGHFAPHLFVVEED